jgi:PhnB protein
MAAKYKPEGYSSVSPYLVAKNAARVIEFLQEALEGKLLRRFDHADGSVMHAEVCIGETVIMIGDGGGDWPPFDSWIHVYVNDVDAVYQRALKAGGVSVQEPQVRAGDFDKRGGVKDPSGNTWWIATQVAEVAVD